MIEPCTDGSVLMYETRLGDNRRELVMKHQITVKTALVYNNS